MADRRTTRALLACLLLALATANTAPAGDAIRTLKDERGWQLLVDGEPYYIKGIVWGYTPRNRNYTYDLWAEPEDFIRKVLDYDFGLLRQAGVNTVRSFSLMPPRWVSYVYREHGIMTVINPLVGRYGAMVAGEWVPFVDYSDEATRAVLLSETMEVIERYKNVEGVLMYALGNENNYGLSWSSFEIENLPEDERDVARAKSLYTLFNEILRAGKRIDPARPYAIVNGDTQYIDLVAKYCDELDVFGSNVYRGESFTDLWDQVDAELDLPVVFFEFGSDAYDARNGREDQAAQAEILRAQWREMYNNARGNGGHGNSLGGFVFEWRDEWWKYLQTERLDIHDDHASWANAGYPFDHVEGRNNMNEEWFGIAALGTANADGVYEAHPRLAYRVLQQIWRLDPYDPDSAARNEAIDRLRIRHEPCKGTQGATRQKDMGSRSARGERAAGGG